MKNILSKLSVLFSPVAVGIYITFTFAYLAVVYYTSQSKATADLTPLESLMLTAHQKSIDFRLQTRGERMGSDKVGLLVVDDRAVNSVGRWPWPRETIAKALNSALQYGAKVIAFDAVFSEPSIQQAAEAFAEVKSKRPIPPDIAKDFEQAITERDSDRMMADFFTQNAPRLVLGSFGAVAPATHPLEYFDSCMDMIFSTTPAFKLWTEKETPLISLEQRPEIPETLKAFYGEHLKSIAEATREGRKPKNFVEQHDLDVEVYTKQARWCESWLQPEHDETFNKLSENWPAILEVEGEGLKKKAPTFQAWVDQFRQSSAKNAVPLVYDWTMNLPQFTEKSDSYNTGYFIAAQDPDGSIRRNNLILHTGSTYMPSIALKAYLVATKSNAQIKFKYNARNFRNEVDRLEILDENGDTQFNVPVDAQGRLAINYAGRQKMFPYVSLADLLTDSPEMTYEAREFDKTKKIWREITKKVKKAEFLKDKLFIFGATAIGIFDLRVTPFEENYPGVETHANVLDNLMRQDFLVTNPNEELSMLAGILGLGIFLSIALSYLGALPGLSLVTLLLFCLTLVDKYIWFGHGTVVTIVLPLTLILTLFIFLTSYKYFTEERSKRELRGTFQKYVSPAIVEEILSDPTKIELGGRKANVTVFFSDVRGFTTISEKLDPRALSDLLNEYLTPMTDLVFKNRGTLDKYMGDAIMGFFGAPIAYSDHAKFACRCALQHIQKLRELQAEFARRGLPEIDIGIGLNTGEVSVGNMGSQTVRSYTVMGDAVNLASRLEGINKQYGTRIIISEFTYEQVRNDFVCREVDWVRVKGKLLPVKIYELMTEGQAPEDLRGLLTPFAEGYRQYHEGQWQKALASFSDALKVKPDDQVTQLYVERCNEYLVTPPPADWDGVFVMKTK